MLEVLGVLEVLGMLGAEMVGGKECIRRKRCVSRTRRTGRTGPHETWLRIVGDTTEQDCISLTHHSYQAVSSRAVF